MDIVFIAIGNELLNGKIEDKNTFWLSQFCRKNGYNLRAAHIISDEYAEFEKIIDTYQTSNLTIVTSGGMGPTKDDQTKHYISKYFSLPLEFNQDALAITQRNYQEKNRTYNKQYKYELIPSTSKALLNKEGFAPAINLKIASLDIYCLPGVPKEFTTMIEQYFPKKNDTNKHLIFRTKELGETKIFNELEPTLWESLEKYGKVASLPHTMSVDISVDLNDISKADEVISILKSSKISNYIWNIGSKSLEEVIIESAASKNITFGFAESCTGGLLSSRITDIAGSSKAYPGGVCSYANSVKEGLLNVKEHTLKNHGAVSLKCAKEMASGTREALGCDIAIATTGIAGPAGAVDGKPVGTVCIGVSSKSKTTSYRFEFNGQRVELKNRFATKALFLLLDEINNY